MCPEYQATVSFTASRRHCGRVVAPNGITSCLRRLVRPLPVHEHVRNVPVTRVAPRLRFQSRKGFRAGYAGDFGRPNAIRGATSPQRHCIRGPANSFRQVAMSHPSLLSNFESPYEFYSQHSPLKPTASHRTQVLPSEITSPRFFCATTKSEELVHRCRRPPQIQKGGGRSLNRNHRQSWQRIGENLCDPCTSHGL